MCQVQSSRSGLLELDFNYSFTDCHCVLGKQKPLHARSASLVSSSNTSEVQEEEEKDRNKTLFGLIISDWELVLVTRICLKKEKYFRCSAAHSCAEKNMLPLGSRDGMIQMKIVALKIKILVYIKDILLWRGQVCADRSPSPDPYEHLTISFSLMD